MGRCGEYCTANVLPSTAVYVLYCCMYCIDYIFCSVVYSVYSIYIVLFVLLTGSYGGHRVLDQTLWGAQQIQSITC